MLQRSLERKTFGKYLWEHGGTQELIADSVADLTAARLLTLDCAAGEILIELNSQPLHIRADVFSTCRFCLIFASYNSHGSRGPKIGKA
jgi:alkylation response protein AidB-like acyl-CoA dehydrogenase